MKDKKLFEGISPLYVNFAMKRGERQEALLKKKEEMYRLSQKMTIFAKIKDESLIVKIKFNRINYLINYFLY